jgi:hypothetical protein
VVILDTVCGSENVSVNVAVATVNLVPGSANQWSMPDLHRALLESELQANEKILLKATKIDGDWVYCMHGSFASEFNHSERRVRGYLVPCLN